MTQVTMPTASLAALIEQASRFAENPRKSFSSMTGILFEVKPQSLPGFVLVKATDGIVRFTRYVRAEISGEDATWRLPAGELTKLASGLKGGDAITLIDGEPTLRIKGKGLRARIPMIQDVKNFLSWPIRDPSELVRVPGFIQTLASVEWAAANGAGADSTFSSVSVTPEYMVATDGYTMAYSQIEFDPALGSGLLPTKTLTQVIDQEYDPLAKFFERELVIQVDPYTQLAITLVAGKYKNITGLLKFFTRPTTVNVEASEIQDALRRALAFSDEHQHVTMSIDQDELHIAAGSASDGALQISIPLQSREGIEMPMTMKLNAAMLANVLRGAKVNVSIGFDPERTNTPLAVQTTRAQSIMQPVRGEV